MQINHRVTGTEAGRTVKSLLYKNMCFSSTMIRRLKKNAGVLVNEKPVYLNHRLKEGDLITINIITKDKSSIKPQPLPVDIVFEDQHLLIVNKPAGMLVHPLKHEPENTLANAVVYYYQQQNIEAAFHPVSRLDRDTSGLVVVAKHPHSGYLLSKQLHTRNFQREYLAVVHGEIKHLKAVIALPIARCPGSSVKHRVDPGGRKAVTHYQVIKTMNDAALVRLRLETGRTHQIRVHMSHIGHPLVGDELYGGSRDKISRQALHCCRVKLVHPITGEQISKESSLPRDMQNLLSLYQE
ncbi:MAG: RluA family pseudouridine synthase [Desulfotomaculum sp.]|nr:RluA family pseudouridine synthase [Desulfotomaculum sp.]